MSAFVIDVNVLIVANGRETAQVSPQCVLNCIEFLEEAQAHLIVLDESGLIFEEYQNYNSFQGQPGVGDAFFKWIYNNQFDSERCERVTITPTVTSLNPSLEEVPLELRIKDANKKIFDLDDHIWSAVARASQHKPVIVNAVDSDWREWQKRLEQHRFQIRFLD